MHHTAGQIACIQQQGRTRTKRARNGALELARPAIKHEKPTPRWLPTTSLQGIMKPQPPGCGLRLSSTELELDGAAIPTVADEAATSGPMTEADTAGATETMDATTEMTYATTDADEAALTEATGATAETDAADGTSTTEAKEMSATGATEEAGTGRAPFEMGRLKAAGTAVAESPSIGGIAAPRLMWPPEWGAPQALCLLHAWGAGAPTYMTETSDAGAVETDGKDAPEPEVGTTSAAEGASGAGAPEKESLRTTVTTASKGSGPAGMAPTRRVCAPDWAAPKARRPALRGRRRAALPRRWQPPRVRPRGTRMTEPRRRRKWGGRDLQRLSQPCADRRWGVRILNVPRCDHEAVVVGSPVCHTAVEPLGRAQTPRAMEAAAVDGLLPVSPPSPTPCGGGRVPRQSLPSPLAVGMGACRVNIEHLPAQDWKGACSSRWRGSMEEAAVGCHLPVSPPPSPTPSGDGRVPRQSLPSPLAVGMGARRDSLGHHPAQGGKGACPSRWCEFVGAAAVGSPVSCVVAPRGV